MFYLTISETVHLNLNFCTERDTFEIFLADLKAETRMGCYVYLQDKTPLYVGRSAKLHSRLVNHATKKRFDEWTHIGIVFSETPHILEKALIRQLKPTFNK